MHLLSIQPKATTDTQTQTPTWHPQIQSILDEYPQFFQDPHVLPPPRPHDHHIPLLPNTSPVNVKPYY